MNRREASRRLESVRLHISHDLFENRFGGGLEPGWKDERLTERDVILRALQGDKKTRDDVAEAMRIWGEEVLPLLRDLFDSVTKVYGFETTDAWKESVKEVNKAVDDINGVFEGQDADGLTSLDEQDAMSRARSFWDACDTVRNFLRGIRERSSEFFSKWNPETIQCDPKT